MERYGECADWAEREFGGAELGDVRRTERLVQIACGAASQVGAALSTVCGKSGSQAATRVFGRDETTIDAVTAPHIKQTSIRCSGLSRILAVQDTSSLDLTTHKSVSAQSSWYDLLMAVCDRCVCRDYHLCAGRN